MMPDHVSSAKTKLEKLLQCITQQLRDILPVGSFEERERAALEFCNEVARRTFQQELQDIADSFAQFVEYRGRVYRRHQLASGRYPCLCGPIEAKRYTYRLVGVRNGPTIVPAEPEAGLIEGATPALARIVAHGYGENHRRAHLALLEKAYRLPPPRAALERLAKRLAANVTTRIPVIEPKIRRLERVPDNARAIVIGVDRTSAPMEEPSLKPARPRYAFTPQRASFEDGSVDCHAARASLRMVAGSGNSDGGAVRASRASQAARRNAKILRFC